MKKFLLFVISAITAIGMQAEYSYLLFRTQDGETRSVGLTGLNISFANDEMLASAEGESVTIALSSLKSMEFSTVPSGIDKIGADRRHEGEITVYSPCGQWQGVYESSDAARAALPGGIYIFKAGNGLTSKILIAR